MYVSSMLLLFWMCLQSVSLIVTGIGAILLMKGAYPQSTFFTGGLLLFAGTIVLEGISMSLASKVRIGCIALASRGSLSTNLGVSNRQEESCKSG